ncbi:MAG: VOC family protein [Pseudonocardia sp.]|nr:VOC family protein [Pseudonocardia sp.]
MTVSSVTHLNFQGDARAALEFYRSVVDGRLVIATNEQAGFVDADAQQVAWGQVTADNGFHVMAYDVRPGQVYDPGTNPFFLSLRGDTSEEISALWAKLAEGATIVEPLAPTQWSPLYGMLTDRFGVTWVVDVAVQYAAS